MKKINLSGKDSDKFVLVDAARAYDSAAKFYHGEFAVLNNI